MGLAAPESPDNLSNETYRLLGMHVEIVRPCAKI